MINVNRKSKMSILYQNILIQKESKVEKNVTVL